MANETGQSLVSTLYATDIVSQQVGESLTSNIGVASTVWVEQAVGTTAVKFGLSAAMTASTFTDTTGMSLSAYNPTQVTVTAAAHGVASRVTGFASSLRPDTLVRVGEEQGKAVLIEIDTDLTALFPSLTASVSRTGTTLRVQDFLSGIGKLNIAKVPTQDRYATVTAAQLRDLMNDAQATNAYAFQQAVKTGEFGPLWGIPIIMSQTCANANSNVDGVGAIYNRRAFGLGSQRGVQVEVLRAPAQFNATDIATTVYYGVALIDTNRGVKLVSQVA